jgi:uncharacterized membrane protein
MAGPKAGRPFVFLEEIGLSSRQFLAMRSEILLSGGTESMDMTTVCLLVFGIGVIAGLRSMTAPAAVSWAAHLKWITLTGSPLAFMGTLPATIIFSLLAVGELVNDKLPKTPNRTTPVPLIARLVLGGFSGAVLCASVNGGAAIGLIVGAIGALVGTFGGYYARKALVAGLKAPDFAIALMEDAIAVGGAFFIVSRF